MLVRIWSSKIKSWRRTVRDGLAECFRCFHCYCLRAIVFDENGYVWSWVHRFVCVCVCVTDIFHLLSYSFCARRWRFFCEQGWIARIIANNVRVNVPSSNRYVPDKVENWASNDNREYSDFAIIEWFVQFSQCIVCVCVCANWRWSVSMHVPEYMNREMKLCSVRSFCSLLLN